MKYLTILSSVLLPAALAAQEAPKSAIAKGSLLVDGSAFLARVNYDNNNPGSTIITISPSILYFAANKLAIGGNVTLGHSSTGDNVSTIWSIGPEVRYYFAQLQAKTLPFIQGSFGIGRTAFSGPPANFNVSNTTLDGSAGVTWLLVPHVGVTGEAFAQRSASEASVVGTPKIVSTSFGLRFGISAFVF